MRCLYVQRPEADEARDDLGWDEVRLSGSVRLLVAKEEQRVPVPFIKTTPEQEMCQ
jgi:predicted RNA binding protein YcfA (HicA-like mRNA interferase family)